jgi:steroid 5-alpha reductase family enzyme
MRRQKPPCYSLLATRYSLVSIAWGGAVSAITALSFVARAAMSAPAAMQRKAVGLVVVAVLALRVRLMGLMLRRLPAGDERRQPVDVAVSG